MQKYHLNCKTLRRRKKDGAPSFFLDNPITLLLVGKESALPSDYPDNFRESGEEELNIHSFVVRVWLEEKQTNPRLVIWRGQITYVNNGDRHYFDDINEIPAFIAPHLKEAG